MEGSSTAGKRPDESSSSSGGADPTHPSPSSSTALASKRRQGPCGPPSKSASGPETVFRLLCHPEKIGSVIGKGGAVVRQIRAETGARVHIEDPVPGSNDRVVFVVADGTTRRRREGEVVDGEEEPSPAQMALVRVFERIEGEGGDDKAHGTAACRLLVPSIHVGCVLGKGGKIVEKIRLESGAQVRIFAKELLPPCAVAGDELIQISGSFFAVKKALLSVSSCLQDNIRAEPTIFSTVKPYMGSLQGPVPHTPLDTFPQRGYLPNLHGLDYHHRSYSNPLLDNTASGLRKLPEEEVVFRLLCTNEKVGSIIGKSGMIVQSLQNETRAAIKIIDAVSDSDDRIIWISAYESHELKHSPAQDAVLRVHSKLAEACIDQGSVISSRLLVPAQQIGCLLGKGGSIIAEMRRLTGANIKIFVKDQVPKCAQANDELVQVSGSFQSVREALLHITNRLRETFFAPRHYPNIVTSQYLPPLPEMMPPCRPRNDTPPVRYPNVGFPHALDPSIESPRNRSTSSPKLWTPQNGNPKGAAMGSATQAGIFPSKTVTVAVPQRYMAFVHGESDGNLTLIREISGANITINDPKPGTYEGTIVLSGSQKQTSTAQGLLHAFILNGL